MKKEAVTVLSIACGLLLIVGLWLMTDNFTLHNELNHAEYKIEAFKQENKGLREQFYITESNRVKERDDYEEKLFLKDDVIKQLKARLESESVR